MEEAHKYNTDAARSMHEFCKKISKLLKVCSFAGCEEMIPKTSTEEYCKECLKVLRKEVNK